MTSSAYGNTRRTGTTTMTGPESARQSKGEPNLANAADLLLRNVQICDGSGAPLRHGHVVVRGDRIGEVLGLDETCPPAKRIVEADHCVLAPGFIDVHAHSDYTVLAAPASESKITQGVTTEIVGNCGFSAFPLRGALQADEQRLQSRLPLSWNWSSAEQYFERLEAARPAVNLATFVGHRNIRGCVMGFADRRPSHGELRAMIRELESALEAGALGLSTGLIYPPGMFADTAELTELARAAGRRQAMYASHVRGEGDRLLSAAREFFEIVDQAQIAAQYSHLKASGRRNWGKVAAVISEIEQRAAEGRAIAFDRYPYTASSTELSSLLPHWVLDGGTAAALERLRNVELRQQIRSEMEEDFGETPPWNDILLAEMPANEFSKYQGWTLADVARELGAQPFDLFVELLCVAALDVWMVHFSMSEEDMVRVLTHPLCMVCSDAQSRPLHGPLGEGRPHPRGCGAFVRFLELFVREKKLLSLEEAVRKMTSLPAQAFGLDARGLVRSGFAADLVLFDLNKIADKGEFGAPPRKAAGIAMVIVNGAVTYEKGALTGARSGRVLRRENR
ncbi:MAG: N-acyl-D-amino-acid deacylase family protein [Candidatus Sumerlaeaceae bacterium]